MSTSFSTIPLLDLSLAQDASTKPGLLRDLHDAITRVGFLYVRNHGVPDVVIDDIVSLLPDLFSLPGSVRDEEVALRNSPHFLGYSGVGAETTAKRMDHREQFEFATELPDTYTPEKDPPYTRLYGPNQWPSSLPTARHIISAYISALTTLSTNFLHLVAESLSLPPETFLSYLSPQHRLKIVRYTPSSSSSSSSSPTSNSNSNSTPDPTTTTTTTTTQGVGPHKDSSGWWTFLLQASPSPSRKPASGLQALNKSGSWIDVPPIPGTFVVNIGQAFEVVTNGVCRATTHRVVLSGSTRERYSIPFFQGVRGSLTKNEAKALWGQIFFPSPLSSSSSSSSSPSAVNGDGDGDGHGCKRGGVESEEGKRIDSAFLTGKYDTWGESQLRTKIRSHRDVGRRFYANSYEKYINDDV